jgi:hypothetical protein
MAVFSTVFEREGEGSGEVEGLAHVFLPARQQPGPVCATTWRPIAYSNP